MSPTPNAVNQRDDHAHMAVALPPRFMASAAGGQLLWRGVHRENRLNGIMTAGLTTRNPPGAIPPEAGADDFYQCAMRHYTRLALYQHLLFAT